MSDEDTKETIELDLPERFKGKAFRELNPELETQNPEPAPSPEPETINQKPETAEAKPSAILVKIERVTLEHGKTAEETKAIKALLANGPLVRLPYEDGSGLTPHWDFAAEQDTFEVPVIVADAAVATGFFRAVE